MDWFHNLQVRTKLVFSFSILMVLLVVLSLTSYYSTRTMVQLVSNMHANQLLPIKDIANANIYAVYQNRALYRYIGEVDPDLKAQALVNVDKFEKGMWDFLASYRKTYLTQREVDLLTRFDQAWATYKQYASEILKLAQTPGQDGEPERNAFRLMGDKGRPAFDIADGLLSDLVKVNAELASQSMDESQAIYQDNLQILIAIASAAFLICLILALLVTRSILRQLGATLPTRCRWWPGSPTGISPLRCCSRPTTPRACSMQSRAWPIASPTPSTRWAPCRKPSALPPSRWLPLPTPSPRPPPSSPPASSRPVPRSRR